MNRKTPEECVGNIRRYEKELIEMLRNEKSIKNYFIESFGKAEEDKFYYVDIIKFILINKNKNKKYEEFNYVDIVKFVMLHKEQLKEKDAILKKKRILMQNVDLLYSLIFNYVKKMVNYYVVKSNQIVLKEDVMQEAYLGFVKAVKKYDFEKGNKFLTFANYEIKAKVLLFLNNNLSVQMKTPYFFYPIRKKIKNLSKLERRKISDYSIEELSKKINVSKKVLSRYFDYKNHKYININECRNSNSQTDSFVLTNEEFIDIDKDGTEEKLNKKEKTEYLMKKINNLPKREREIVLMRYGFFGGDGKNTLQEVAKKQGISQERVRQIEKIIKNEIRLHMLKF